MLCTPPLFGIVFALVSEDASITSTAPEPPTIATYTRFPSRLRERLFGRSLSAMLFLTARVFASTTSSVWFASLVM